MELALGFLTEISNMEKHCMDSDHSYQMDLKKQGRIIWTKLITYKYNNILNKSYLYNKYHL